MDKCAYCEWENNQFVLFNVSSECAFYAGHRILGACLEVTLSGTIYDQEESA